MDGQLLNKSDVDLSAIFYASSLTLLRIAGLILIEYDLILQSDINDFKHNKGQND